MINGNFGPLKGPITTLTIIFGPFWVPIVITNKIFMPILDFPKTQIEGMTMLPNTHGPFRVSSITTNKLLMSALDL